MPLNTPGNDTTPFQQLAAGSQASLQQIELLYKHMLLLHIQKIVKPEALAMEVYADTLHTLWICREEVAQHNNPVAWMMLTARNKAINMLRQEKRKQSFWIEYFPMLESDERIEAQLEEKDHQHLVDLAVEKLSPREKLVFTLNRIEGFNKKEIAEQLGVSENTVRNQLYNALINIRKHLSKMLKSMFV